MWLLSVFFLSLSGYKYNRVKLFYNKEHFVKEAQITTASNTRWRAKLRRSQAFLLIFCQRLLVPQLWDRHSNIIKLASWLVHVLCGFMIMKIYLTDDIFYLFGESPPSILPLHFRCIYFSLYILLNQNW